MGANSFRIVVIILGAGLVASLWWSGLSGRYQLGSDVGQNGAWRIDTTTGRVSICFALGRDKAPECTPWGQRLFSK
jgi:hypothetical protein